MFSHASTPLPKAIRSGMFPAIETFDCPYNTGKNPAGVIRIVFPEFTCVCPRTGYPDFATIHLFYLPRDLCIELKSWKLCLNAFRMVGAFHETVTAHLFDTVSRLIKPRWLLVVGDFLPRGNVDTTVIFESKGPRPVGADVLIGEIAPRCARLGGRRPIMQFPDQPRIP